MQPYKEKQFLEEIYYINKLSTNEIGEICHVDGSTISFWMQKFNIPRRTISESLRGRTKTKEHIEKIARSKRGKKLRPHSLETRKKMSLALLGNTRMLGKKRSPETKEKMSKSRRHWHERNGHPFAGKGNPNWGKHLSEETKEKIRRKNSGETAPNWRGGISREPYGFGFNEKLKFEIRKRDDFTCQMAGCGKRENGIPHDVHHKNYDKKDNRRENLITFCKSCHAKTNFNRDFWKHSLILNAHL